MKKSHADNANLGLEIAQALAALVYASDWPKTLKVLEEQQELLLLDRALELLEFTINELCLEGEIDDAENWRQYETLLTNARMFGVRLAWESFMNGIFLNPEEGCMNDTSR